MFAGTDSNEVIKVKNNIAPLFLGKLIYNFKSYTNVAPIYCIKCKAFFSKISEEYLIRTGEETIWNCEFCGESNKLAAQNQLKIPDEPFVYYLLDQNGTIQTNNLEIAQKVYTKQVVENQASIILCIDISGSMDTTLNNLTGVVSSYFKKNDKPTRLECIKYAIDCYINDLRKKNPNAKLGLVCFNNLIHIYGDCSKPLKTLPNKIMSNDYELYSLGQFDAKDYLKNSINISQAHFIECLKGLSCSGATALGPAFLYSLGLAKMGAKGSEIILCTDGLATVGFGSTNSNDPKDINNSRTFYVKMGNEAKKHSVKVSVISIVDEECNLEMLNPIVDSTGGALQKVNPLELNKAFNCISDDSLVATEVNYELHVQHCFEFANNVCGDLFDHNSRYKIEIGNASKNSMYTNEIAFKKPDILNNLMNVCNLDIGSINCYPVQYKIYYKNLVGQNCLLILTQSYDITENNHKIGGTIPLKIVRKHMIQIAANLYKKGKFMEARNFLNNPTLGGEKIPMMEVGNFVPDTTLENQIKPTDSLASTFNSAFKDQGSEFDSNEL